MTKLMNRPWKFPSNDINDVLVVSHAEQPGVVGSDPPKNGTVSGAPKMEIFTTESPGNDPKLNGEKNEQIAMNFKGIDIDIS